MTFPNDLKCPFQRLPVTFPSDLKRPFQHLPVTFPSDLKRPFQRLPVTFPSDLKCPFQHLPVTFPSDLKCLLQRLPVTFPSDLWLNFSKVVEINYRLLSACHIQVSTCYSMRLSTVRNGKHLFAKFFSKQSHVIRQRACFPRPVKETTP